MMISPLPFKEKQRSGALNETKFKSEFFFLNFCFAHKKVKTRPNRFPDKSPLTTFLNCIIFWTRKSESQDAIGIRMKRTVSILAVQDFFPLALMSLGKKITLIVHLLYFYFGVRHSPSRFRAHRRSRSLRRDRRAKLLLNNFLTVLPKHLREARFFSV